MNNLLDKYDAVEWQSFSQKKDIEAIVRNTKEKKNIQLTATVEICLVTLSIAIDNIWANGNPLIWVAIAVLSIIPIGALLLKYIYDYMKKYRPGSDIPKDKDMINVFDNEVCYYVMMAKAYSKKIKRISDEEDIFFYIEMCFYLNKAIYHLSCMENSIDVVFSEKCEEIYADKKISLTRLKNLYNIIEEIYYVIEERKEILKEIDINENYVDLIERYKMTYKEFKKTIKSVFKNIE